MWFKLTTPSSEVNKFHIVILFCYICSEYIMYIYILTWFSPRQHFLIPGYVMMHYFFFHQIEILHISSFHPPLLYFHQQICSMTFTLYILSKRISWSWSCMNGICIQIGFALLFLLLMVLIICSHYFWKNNNIKYLTFGLLCPEWF